MLSNLEEMGKMPLYEVLSCDRQCVAGQVRRMASVTMDGTYHGQVPNMPGHFTGFGGAHFLVTTAQVKVK